MILCEIRKIKANSEIRNVYGGKMARLFISIDLPERIKDDISDLYMAIPGAKWVGHLQLHLTLRFIGETDNLTENKIISVLSTVKVPPFEITIKGVGHFPPRKHPVVLWVGITENLELLRLQSKIEKALTSIGIAPDTRRFHPHITIARLKESPIEKVALFITSNSLFSTEPFAVSQYHLYSSFLKKEGAYHQLEASFPLT